MSTPETEVVVASTPALFEQCMEVRIAVFVKEQGYPLEIEIDEHDNKPTTTHFLLREVDSQSPIGTFKLYPVPQRILPDEERTEGTLYYKLGSVCILEKYRKFKLGSKLVQAGHQWLLNEAPSLYPDTVARGDAKPALSGRKSIDIEVILFSQVYAKGFYARSGYVAYGDEFELDGSPHHAMKIKLSVAIESPMQQS